MRAERLASPLALPWDLGIPAAAPVRLEMDIAAFARADASPGTDPARELVELAHHFRRLKAATNGQRARSTGGW